MNWPMAIVIIVVIMMLGGFLRGRNGKHAPDGDMQGNPEAKSEREQELEAELEQLRERIKVLERIATDENETTRLSAEIDKLRDEQGG